MLILEFVIVLLAIFLGARLGGIGIGFAGGLGVLVLALIGVKPGTIPFDVISIIMAVIAAIAAMQVAGGMDYLVRQTETLLRRNPRHITLLAPVVTYFLTIFAGTGNISLSALPVIAEVAKEQGIRPSRPLSTAVVAAQIAITASPISAAVVYMAMVMEPHGVSYLTMLSILIPATLAAVLLMSLLVSWLFNARLEDDAGYQQRLAEGLVTLRGSDRPAIPASAPYSVLLFLLGVLAVVVYAIFNSNGFHQAVLGSPAAPVMTTTSAILIIMLSVATLITLLCRIDTAAILNASTFKAGMSASICILGVAWLGDTFVQDNLEWIKGTAGSAITSHPWLLAVIFFFCSALLYSQAATAKALMPMAIALGVTPLTALAAFPAVSGLFILPTYPTLVAAVQMDDTGTTRIGRFVFNHPFFIPGTLGVTFAVLFSFALGALLL